jgi:hypothetical protein
VERRVRDDKQGENSAERRKSRSLGCKKTQVRDWANSGNELARVVGGRRTTPNDDEDENSGKSANQEDGRENSIAD